MIKKTLMFVLNDRHMHWVFAAHHRRRSRCLHVKYETHAHICSKRSAGSVAAATLLRAHCSRRAVATTTPRAAPAPGGTTAAVCSTAPAGSAALTGSLRHRPAIRWGDDSHDLNAGPTYQNIATRRRPTRSTSTPAALAAGPQSPCVTSSSTLRWRRHACQAVEDKDV